jgi:hypothetical protein
MFRPHLNARRGLDAMTRSQTLVDLLAIFAFKKKSDLKRHCRSITILQADLASLIYASIAGQTPWSHRAHHREFRPEHLELGDGDLRALVTNGVGEMQPPARKAMNKISAIFDERRLLSGHIFFSPDQTEWHLFYFDQRDFAERDNHWRGGSHIHLINHLWSSRTARDAWSQFCTGNPQLSGALHVRFERIKRASHPLKPPPSDSLGA